MHFVDKRQKGGHYYNTKMTIEDVLSPDTCTCRTDEDRVLEGVRKDMLETLVPKGEGDWVTVVRWPQAGRVDICGAGTECGARLWCNRGQRITWWSFTTMPCVPVHGSL